MQRQRKVLAAIAGAIGIYLQAEAQPALSAAEERRAPEAPRPAWSPWVLAGRQSTMDMRRLFQRRFIR